MVDEVVQIQVKRVVHQLMEKGPGQRKRPHTTSAQPLSLHEEYLAPDSWYNLKRAEGC